MDKYEIEELLDTNAKMRARIGDKKANQLSEKVFEIQNLYGAPSESMEAELRKKVVDLIRKGANLKCDQGFSGNMLSVALVCGQDDLAHLFIDLGFDIKNSPVIYFATRGLEYRDFNTTMLQYLLDNGADINLVHENSIAKNSALHVAAAFKRPDVLEFLLKNGADVYTLNGLGNSAVYEAIHYKKLGNANILVDAGADSKPLKDFFANKSENQEK